MAGFAAGASSISAGVVVSAEVGPSALTKCERWMLGAVALWPQPVQGCTTEQLADSLNHSQPHTENYLRSLHAKGMVRCRGGKRWWPTRAGLNTLEPIL